MSDDPRLAGKTLRLPCAEIVPATESPKNTWRKFPRGAQVAYADRPGSRIGSISKEPTEKDAWTVVRLTNGEDKRIHSGILTIWGMGR